MQVFITSEEAEQGVNPMDINRGMRSYRFVLESVHFEFFLQNKLKDCAQSVIKCKNIFVLCF